MIWTGPAAPETWPGAQLSDRDDLIEILVLAAHLGVADVIFQTGRPVLCKLHGRTVALTTFPLQKIHVERAMKAMTGQESIVARLVSANDVDAAFNVPDHGLLDAHNLPTQHRFRFSATACDHDGSTGYQVVLRYIPSRPPTLSEVGFPPELVEHIAPRQGAILIAGPTGSGKSTTFAACVRHIIEGNTRISGNVVIYEHPIEYLFGDIPSSSCTVAQQEIGVHLKTFADGARNALRRAPDLVVVGEMRDAPTIEAATTLVKTGHPLYGTVHAGSAAQVFRRLAMYFPSGEQDQALADLLETTHLVIFQQLVPAVAGGRVCLREWLLIDDRVRETVLAAPRLAVTSVLRDLIATGNAGRSLVAAATRARADGLISAETEADVVRSRGSASPGART
jgi:defect-in-organelle-trafficking protein DotB